MLGPKLIDSLGGLSFTVELRGARVDDLGLRWMKRAYRRHNIEIDRVDDMEEVQASGNPQRRYGARGI